MTGDVVESMAEDMMVQRFPWYITGPVKVAESARGGIRIIIDGHHRTAAAILAELESIPIQIIKVSKEQWDKLMLEVLEAAGVR